MTTVINHKIIRAGIVLALMLAILSPSLAAPDTPVFGDSVAAAEAATTRFGSRAGQVDVLFGADTRNVAKYWWPAVYSCWGVTVSAAGGPTNATGAVAAFLVGGMYCITAVKDCTLRAAYKGKWAGMTIHPGGYFCWTY